MCTLHFRCCGFLRKLTSVYVCKSFVDLLMTLMATKVRYLCTVRREMLCSAWKHSASEPVQVRIYVIPHSSDGWDHAVFRLPDRQ